MILREKIRPYQPGDAPGIVATYNAAARSTGGDVWLTVEFLKSFLNSPLVDAARDAFIVEREGQIIGYADTEFSPESGRGRADGAVHPEYCGQGIGTQLLHLTEARILERAQAALPPDQPVSVYRHAAATNLAAIHLLEAEGYRSIRTSYRMRIEFDQPVEAPPLPDGLTLRPFDPARHGYAVYQAHQEAFADHWGFEPNGYEEWSHFLLDEPNPDFSLWRVAYDGDQVAGLCISYPYAEEDPQMAWVRILAVRRPWRKRGLGYALLRQSFAQFQQRGFSRVGLGVDAASLTNAVALYERAGMQVYKRILLYHKLLRGVDTEITPPAT